MPQADSLQQQAEESVVEARRCESEGRADEALTALHRAVLLYASADAEPEIKEEATALTRPRADACRQFADALVSAGRYAEAANIYQEATDLYGLIRDEEAERLAGRCARDLLQCVAALRSLPQERLHLLVAHYERVLQQLALEPGTEAKQADCCMHIARIYQRRDRPDRSAEQYRHALELLAKCDDAVGNQLARAECHHRLAVLLADHLEQPAEAVRHYRAAIDLYNEYEPSIYGVQQSKGLCRAGLARSEMALRRLEHDPQRSYE